MDSELNLNELSDAQKRMLWEEMKKEKIPYSKMSDSQKELHQYMVNLKRKKSFDPALLYDVEYHSKLADLKSMNKTRGIRKTIIK